MIKKSKIALFLMLIFLQVLYAKKEPETPEIDVIQMGLNDANQDIKITAIQATAFLKDFEYIRVLKKTFEDKSDFVKIEASVALFRLGDMSGLPVIKGILRNPVKLSANPTPMERVRSIAKGTVRVRAARALGDIEDKSAFALLKSMLNDDDGRVVDACMVALGKMGDAKSTEQFISAVRSTKPEVRVKALEAIGEIGDRSALEAIRERLKDWNRDAKTAAALTLAKLNDKEAIPGIKELLFDEDPIVREKATTALGMLADKKELAAFKRMYDDENGMVRLAASEAMYKLGEEKGRDFILKVLENEDKDAKLRALMILESVGSLKDIDRILPVLNDYEMLTSVTAAKTIVAIKKKNSKEK